MPSTFLPLQIAPPLGYGFTMKWLIPYGIGLVAWARESCPFLIFPIRGYNDDLPLPTV